VIINQVIKWLCGKFEIKSKKSLVLKIKREILNDFSKIIKTLRTGFSVCCYRFLQMLSCERYFEIPPEATL
jgi:hypothetical protein